LIEKSPEPEQLPRDNILPSLPNSSAPSRAPSLTPTLKEFRDLTFDEVWDLARKQHKDFNELNGHEIQKLARKKYDEDTVHAESEDFPSQSSLPHASRAFKDLTFDEVWDLARKQHKDFNQLNGHEIRELARQKHSEAMVCADYTDARQLHFIWISG
jgi:hypothetical protein